MHGTLMFTNPADVIPDDERLGLLRAPHASHDLDGDIQVCRLEDLADPDTSEPGLEAAGFETVDLSGNAPLQQALADVSAADHLSQTTNQDIRDAISGSRFDLSNGRSLRVDLVVDDGLFYRRSGPNWTDVNPGGIDGINGHGGAQYVHGDQDVYGTPLRQLLGDEAPNMFRHVTPDGRNDEADTFLLNLWIPLHAPVQPLALMDRRTLDGPRHQLRYGLPVDGFLERDDDASVNDIWSFLHHETQQWYVRTDMGPDQGYVFDTLGVGHGAAVLAGEETLAQQYLWLHHACESPEGTPATPLPTLPLPAEVTPAIRKASERMAELIDQARDEQGTTAEWREQARAAIDSVIRRSIEMRLVASLVNEAP